MNSFLRILTALALLSLPSSGAASPQRRAAVRALDVAASAPKQRKPGASPDAGKKRSPAKPSAAATARSKAKTKSKAKTTSKAKTKPDSKAKKKTASGTRASAKAPALAWPVSSRKIVEAYGERVNATTKTVTVNPGINIAAREGTIVKAAAAGTVSLVSWLPSYGTFVIVEHRDGYRTVYANLASTSVAAGKTVRSGSKVGKVGEIAGRSFLHFEVWRNQTRLDPTTMLR